MANQSAPSDGTNQVSLSLQSAPTNSGEKRRRDTLSKLPEEIIFLHILSKLSGEEVLPMIMVSRSWASFILHDAPGLMFYNQPANPTPNSILFDILPIPDCILVGLPPETRQICTESRFQIVSVKNSYVRPRFPVFPACPKFFEKGEIPTVVGSSGGIICFHIISASRFVLVNPLTKYYKEVSTPKVSVPHLQPTIRANDAGFFCDESSGDMKIVQFLRLDSQNHNLGLSRNKTLHSLRIYSVKSGKWDLVSLKAVKTPPGYICGLHRTLPKPLATFVDPFDIVPESSFLVDLREYFLTPVPDVGGVELSFGCICWLNKIGVRTKDNCIYVLDEHCETWKEYATLPDEVSHVSFCLDGGNIVMVKGGQKNMSDYNLFNSTTGAQHHILSLPDCRLFPYVPTLLCVDGMKRF